MEKKCSVELCDQSANFACLCSSSYLCANHVASHLLTAGIHNYVLLSRPINKESQSLIFHSLLSHLNYLSLLRKKVLSESSMLIQETLKKTSEFTKQILSLEENIHNSLKVLNNNLKSTSPVTDYLHALCFARPETVQKELNAWSFPVITPATRKVLKELETLFKLEFVKLPFTVSENKYLYFFADNSVMFNSMNIDKNTIQCFRLPLKQDRGTAASICYLSGSKIFYGGGFVKNKTIANYFIIDENSGDINLINGGKARRQAGCCFFDDKIWVYGGCEADRALKNCEKFDLNTLKWEDFTDLPSCSDTSVCSFDSQLFVTGGQLSGLFQHFPEQNSYLNLFSGLSPKNKFLCAGHGKLYLIHENKVYISDDWNQFKWTCLPLDSELGKYWITTWVLYKGNIFFTTGHYAFFNNAWPKARKLDLTTFQLTDIA